MAKTNFLLRYYEKMTQAWVNISTSHYFTRRNQLRLILGPLALAFIAACQQAPDYKDFDTLSLSLTTNAPWPAKFDQDEIVPKCELPAAYQPYEKFNYANHMLASDSEGTLPSGWHEQSVEKAYVRIMEGFVDWVESAEPKPEKPRLLFYFNGGLNPQHRVVRQAIRQVPCMLKDGIYPVFMIWDTDFLSTYGEQVFEISNGQHIDDGSLIWQTPFLIIGDVVSGLGHAPTDYIIHGQRYFNALQRKPRCWMMLNPGENEGCPDGHKARFVEEGKPVDAERNVVVDQENVDNWDFSIPGFLGYSATLPLRLISTPLAHGIGEEAWKNMNRRTRITIRRSDEYDLDKDDPRIPECQDSFGESPKQFPAGCGVFAQFFHQLERFYLNRQNPPLTSEIYTCHGSSDAANCPPESGKEDEDTPSPAAQVLNLHQRLSPVFDGKSDTQGPVELVMIGHSMGAIVINELVSRFPGLPYSDIVFMAAAASIRESERMLKAYFPTPDELPERRFFNLMLHPLNDALELQSFGTVPSGSLLAWIEGMYEIPKTPADRVIGHWPSAKAAKNLLAPEIAKNSLFRVFNASRESGSAFANPVEHGHFNDDEFCFWRPAFWGVTGLDWESRYEDLPPQAKQQCPAE